MTLFLTSSLHVDGRVDTESFTGFIKGYQTVASLSMGELWAIPIMLRLALVENLRRIMARIIVNRGDWDKANDWVDKLLETAERQPGDLILLMADLARTNRFMRTSFIADSLAACRARVRLSLSRSRGLSSAWTKKGLTLEQVVQDENRQQAATRYQSRTASTVMRFVDEMDWHAFIEDVSIVEHSCTVTSGTYATWISLRGTGTGMS